MPLRNWQQHAEPVSAPPAIDGARETGQPVLPRGRVLGVNECVSQGLSSQKPPRRARQRRPAHLRHVRPPAGICLAAASRRGRASTRRAEVARCTHVHRRLRTTLRRRDPRVGLFFRSEGSACGGVMGPRVVCLVLLLLAGSASLSRGSCLLRNTSVERTRSLSFSATQVGILPWYKSGY